MAIERNFIGFEMADFGELNYGSGGAVSGALNSLPSDATARSGDRYHRCATATNGANLCSFPAGSIVGTSGTVSSGNHKRVAVRAYIRIESHAQNGQIRILGFGNDAGTCTVQFGAQNTSGGFLQPGTKIGLRIGGQSHNSGAVGAYPWGTVDLSTGVWYRFLLDIDLDVQATTVLSATLRVTEDSDSPSVDFTLTNSTNIGATDNIDKLAVGYSNALIGAFARTVVTNIDDIMYVATSDSDASSGQPSLPTQTHIYAIIPPTGAASQVGWSGSFADVDEYPVSGADTMSSSTAAAEVDFTHATSIALGYSQVQAMKAYANALVTGAGTGVVDYLLNGTAKSATLGANYPSSIAIDPVVGVLFSTMTPSAFSATTFGIRKNNGTQATVLANIGLEVIGTLAAYGTSGNQIRGETQIKAGSIYDAQVASAAAIKKSKIQGLNDGPSPVFFPEEPGSDDWVIPGPPGASGALQRLPVIPVFLDADGSGGGDDGLVIPGPPGAAGAAGSSGISYNGEVLLAELTASSSATLDFATRNVAGQSGAMFQSDYDEYIIELINILPATDNVDLLMRYSTDGGSSYVSTGVYDYANFINNVASFDTNTVSATGATSSKIIPTQDNTTANGGACCSLKFYNPLNASQHKQLNGNVSWWNNDSQFYNGTLSFRFATTTAINAFRLLYSSGNIASGVVRVYGLTKTPQSLQQAPAHGTVLLHTQTVSGASTMDIVSRNVGSLSGAIFQSDYDEYIFEIINLQVGTNDAGILGRVSTDGGATFSSTTYARTFQYGAANNTTSGGGATAQAQWDISGNQSNASTNCLCGFLKLFNPLSGALYKQMVGCVAWGHTGVDWISTEYSLIWKTVTAVNAFRFLTSSGTLTGTVRVYGVVKDATYPVASIMTGTHASRPSAGNTGRLYLPSDGYSVARDSGTAWELWGPIFPLTAPVDANFAWINQGGASATAAKDSVYLLAPATTGVSWRIRKKSIGSSTRLELGFLPHFLGSGTQAGIVLRESGTGKLATLALGDTLALAVQHWASATSFTGNDLTGCTVSLMGMLRLAVVFSGANLLYQVSVDGQNWIQIASVAKTTQFTTAPDEWGFAINSGQTTFDTAMNVLSFKES